MPLPVIAGALRIGVTGLVAGGGSWANVWHARSLSLADWDLAAITAFHDIFKQLYIGSSIGAGTEVLQWIATGTSVVQVDYTPLDGTSGAYTLPASGISASGSSMPAEVAECLTIRTALRGRQNRGRIYLPPFAVSAFLPNGHLLAAVVDGIVAQAVGVNAALIVGGAELGVGSYGPYKNPLTLVTSADPAVNGGSSPHFTPVSSFTMDDKADVQRGRKT